MVTPLTDGDRGAYVKFVTIQIEFMTPCLGKSRGHDKNGLIKMMRDGRGNVVFMQTWWQRVLEQAAQGYGRYTDEVRRIKWSPVVLGELGVYRRYYQKSRYRKHECFDAGARVFVRAEVPFDDLDAFQSILSYAGEFYGISPWGWKGKGEEEGPDEEKGYGRFRVVEVRESRYDAGLPDQTSEHTGDQPS